MKKKIIFIAPHLSTGGMPQYLFKQIEAIHDIMDVYCIEWDNVTGGVLVVQRNKIQHILGDKLITFGENKEQLFEVLNTICPDIVHLQEIPEMFMQAHIAEKFYRKDRPYIIIETSHDSGYDVHQKTYLPDKFLMVSNYQKERYKIFDVPCDVVEYPIENKIRTKTREQALRDLGLDPTLKHVINVGLFTPRKNQAEIIEYAKALQEQPIQFHFIGNQADNFRYYWEPLMKDFPPNCKWWNERTDVDNFYQAADLFLFTSRGHATDMETMPLVVRESLSWKVPSLIYNLPVYMGYFDTYDTIDYLTDDLQENEHKILEKLNIHVISPEEQVFYTLNGEEKLTSINYFNNTNDNLTAYGDAAAQYFATFHLKELEHGDVSINEGDVFVDLGANIGMSSYYAKTKGVSEIHCFEPDPALINLIKKNASSAIVHQYAIGNSNSELELYHWPGNEVNGGSKYKCSSITLKDVLRLVGKKIDYLKVDIEGFETTVFDDLTGEDCKLIDRMMIEYHPTSGLDDFCDKLKTKGFYIHHITRGYQSYIYAQYAMVYMKNTISSRWDLENQTIYFNTAKNIDFPVIASLKEYKSDGVMWTCEYDNLSNGIEYWMIPVAKHMHSYVDDEFFSGVKLCIYRKDTEEQIYEMPYVHTFVNVPTVSLSNSIPYHINYREFYLERVVDKWVAKPHGLIVDVGANVGVFTKYMLDMGYTRHSVAVECDPKALKDLNRNFRRSPQVTIIPKALHSTNLPITFYHSPENPVISSTLSPDELIHHMAGVKGNVQRIVDTITIQDLVDMYGTIDLLKIDIEGAEYTILENCDTSTLSNVKSLLIEFHFFEENSMERYHKIISWLRQVGYTVDEIPVERMQTVTGRSNSIYAYKP